MIIKIYIKRKLLKEKREVNIFIYSLILINITEYYL